MANGVPARLEPNTKLQLPPPPPNLNNIPDADRESALSSYGESFQADSPDPKDYFGR